MVLNNNYEKLDNIDNNSLDVNYDSENELNNNLITTSKEKICLNIEMKT